MGGAYAAAGTAIVIVGAVLRWREVPLPWWGVTLAGVAAVVALVHGVTSVISRRTGSADRGLRASSGGPVRWLPAWGATVAIAGWCLLIAGMAAYQGQPSDDGAAGCDFYVSDRGATSCISEREYQVAVARSQSLGLGGAATFLGFGAITAGRPTRKDHLPATHGANPHPEAQSGSTFD